MKLFYTKGKYPVLLHTRDFRIFQFMQFAGATIAKEIIRQIWAGRSESAGAGYRRLRKLKDAGLLQKRGRVLCLTKEAREIFAGVEKQLADLYRENDSICSKKGICSAIFSDRGIRCE
jgi:hypothetical protein